MWVRLFAWLFLAQVVLFLGLTFYYARKEQANKGQEATLSATAKRVEVQRLLDQAWDLMGGKQGTDVIKAPASSEALELARRKIRDALALEPRNANALGKMATYLHAVGRLEEAETLSRESANLSPYDWAAHNNLGIILGSRGKHAEALAAFNEAARLNPAAASPRRNLVNVLIAVGDFRAAEKSLEEAIARDPSEWEGGAPLATAFYKSGDLERALNWQRVLVAAAPDKEDFVVSLAILFDRLGREHEALDTLRTAVAEHPNWSRAWCSFGCRIQKAGDSKGAETAFRSALAANPANVGAAEELSFLLATRGEKREALGVLEPFARSGSLSGTGYYNRGNLLREQGDSKAAMNSYDEAIKRDPNDASARKNRALLQGELDTTPARNRKRQDANEEG